MLEKHDPTGEAPTANLLAEVIDWLRIPSISTGGGTSADMERAASWVVERISDAGGAAEFVSLDGSDPLVIGELRSNNEDAPTILLYGHYDVQDPGPLDLWTSPPFEPHVRDGRLYARGASDDKGTVLPFLHVACALARDGALPVHLRVLIEGEEEVGSGAAMRWVREDARGADAAIVLDNDMADDRRPALTVGFRGLIQLHIEVRGADAELHQGAFGGAVLNAANVLHQMLGAVLGDGEGRLRDELLVGVEPAKPAEIAAWAVLPAGADVIAAAGGRPLDADASDEFYERTGARPALDINSLRGGQMRAVVPATAGATITMRTAAGQRADILRPILERLLRSAAHPSADVSIDGWSCEPMLLDAREPALRLAGEALARACGTDPIMIRTGGSIPIVAALVERAIPVIATGFGRPEDAQHGPDESIRLKSLELGEAAGHELLRALADLPTTS